MADSKERRKTPRKAATATPKPDSPRPQKIPLGGSVRAEISGEETRRQIAEAAYFRAKQRNFEPGHELDDWIEAESEVMGRINGSER